MEELRLHDADVNSPQERLQKSEALFRTLADSIQDIYLGLDRSLRCTYWNRTTEGLFGVPAQHALGKSAYELLPDLKGSALEKSLLDALETEKPSRSESRWSIQGRMRDFENSVFPSIGGLTLLSRDVTDRKRAEEEVERQALLLGQVSDAVIGTDAQARVTYWNRGAEQVFGYAAAEAVGRTTEELLSPQWGPGEREAILADLERRGSGSVTVRCRHRDGHEIIAAGMVTRLADAGGKTSGYVVAHRDVTEQARAEIALRQSEEKFRSLYTAMDEGTVLHEIVRDETGQARDYRILEVNKAFERITGIPRERAVGALASALFEAVGPPYLEVYARVAETGLPETFETYFAPMQKSFRISVFSPAKGQFATVFEDITPRKQAELALRESEDRLKRAQMIAHLGSWELDVVKDVLTWSDEVYRIFGLEPQEFGATYEAFLEYVHTDDRAAVDAAYTGSLREGRDSYEIEHRVVRKGSGEVRIVHERCHHVRDETGKIVRSAGMVHDITERKRAEEALQRSRGRQELLAGVAGRLLSAEQPQEAVNDLCRGVMEFLDCQVFVNFLVAECGVAGDGETGSDGEPEIGGREVVQGPESDGRPAASGERSAIRRLRLNACAGIPRRKAELINRLSFGCAVCGAVAQCGERISVDHILTRPDPRTELFRSMGIDAYCCHPLKAEGQVIGTLSFGTRNRPAFTSDEMELMREVADLVSIAMERMMARTFLEATVAERTAELQRSNQTLAEQAELLGLAREAILVRDVENRITYWNEGAQRLYGWSSAEAIGKVSHELLATVFPTDYRRVLDEVLSQGYWQGDLIHTRRDGTKIISDSRWAARRDSEGRLAAILEINLDVTARRETERRRELMSALLRLFSENADRPQYLDSVAAELQRWTGCRCVGIRVVDKDGAAPYAACVGFSPEFRESECWLMLERDRCICSRLMTGTSEPQDRPALTPGGSFCCGDSIGHEASLPPSERARFCGPCMKSGFATIAFLPIRYRDEIVAAIHLADERSNALSQQQVQAIESITGLIGEALQRFRVELELTEHRDHLSELVDRATGELSEANARLRKEIAERRSAEEELRKTHDYLENLLDHANAPIIVWDPESRITRFNRAFERLTGQAAAEVVGRGLEVLFPPDRLEESMELVRRASMGERLEVVEIPIQRKDGSVRVVLWNSATLLGTDGKTAIATIAQGQDITERKQAEAQLKASLTEKGLLLSEVHHRVKNNLQIISSLLNLRFRKVRDSKTMAAFEDSQARIRSIALIHERLYRSQDFARIDFAGYVSDLARSLFRSLSVNPGQVRLKLEIGSFALPLDTATPLGLMVNELITNSLKHAFPNARAGKIFIGLKQAGARNLVLTCGDDGVGLPPDFALDGSSGLGMRLVTLLAAQVNGKVEVSRQKGAEFRITIPASDNVDGEAGNGLG